MYIVNAYLNGKLVFTYKFVKFKNFRSFYLNLIAQMTDNSIDYNLILVRKYDEGMSILGNFAVLKTALFGPVVKIVNLLDGTEHLKSVAS